MAEKPKEEEKFSDHGDSFELEKKDEVAPLQRAPTYSSAGSIGIMRRATTIMRSNLALDQSKELQTQSDEIVRKLLCTLCKNVLMDPQECTGCEANCCANCFDDWSSKTPHRCPNGCISFEYKDANSFLKMWLKQLKIKCENTEFGCSEVCEYDKLKEHQAECSFVRVQCKNQGCPVVLPAEDAAAHADKCEFERDLCSKCSEIITKGQKEEHQCVNSLIRRVEQLEMMLKSVVARGEMSKSELDKAKYQIPSFDLVRVSGATYYLPWFLYGQHCAPGQIEFFAGELSEILPKTKKNFVKALLLRIHASDASVRQRFSSCTIYQKDNDKQRIELANYIVGPLMPGPQMIQIPIVCEVMLPLDPFKEAKLIASCDFDPMHQYGFNQMNYGLQTSVAITIAGFVTS